MTAGAALLPATPISRGNADGFAEGLSRFGFEVINFSTARGQDQSVLELNQIAHPESLGQSPLEMEIDISLGDDEFIVPLIFDGEHLLLAGDTWKDDAGRTQLAIHQVPEDRSGSRSAFSAFKLYFFKTVCGFKHVNSLARFEFNQDGAVTRSTTGIGEAVHSSERILLLVHGLFGDSEVMARQIGQFIAESDAGSWPFDLVLGYDFESINTPIEETARELKIC